MSDDLFLFGDEAESEQEKIDRDRAAASIRRFWIPPDPSKETRITFIDDDSKPCPELGGKVPPPQFYEHQLYLNGHWRNWFTCLGKGSCPICKSGKSKAYFAGAYTVIDHTEWEDKQGRKHKDEIRLLIAKGDVLRLIKHISAKKGGLRGLQVDVLRKGPKDPSVGSNFDYIKHVKDDEAIGLNGEEVMFETIKPLDYKEILARKTEEDLMEVVGTVKKEEEEIQF